MKTALVSSNQVRYFTLGYYFRELAAGSAIVYGGLREEALVYIGKAKFKLRGVFKRFRRRDSSRDVEQLTNEAKRNKADDSQLAGNLSAASSATSLVQLVGKRSSGNLSTPNERLQQIRGEDDHPTTLHFGFVLLSKMLNTCILFIPAFALNLRFGLSPSRLFVMLSYLLLMIALFAGIQLSSFILDPSVQLFVGKMNGSLKSICLVSAAIGQVGYITYSMISCAYILYQRQFLQNFIYHSCSIITLARSYQRRQMVSLFIAFNLFAFMAEPLFGLLAISHDVQQPAYWPQLELNQFKLAKWLTFLGCGLGAGAISSGTVIIPLMTCFLITASMKHLKNLVQKQASRCKQTAIWDLENHNSRLLALLNPKTRAIMEEFACETLTMDWPEMIETPSALEQGVPLAQSGDSILTGSMSLVNEVSSQASSRVASAGWLASNLMSPKSSDMTSGSSLKNSASGPELNLMLDSSSGKINSSQASSLLFLYKNLVKSLSELKCVILDYEQRFGSFHQIISLLSCLIVSLWVTSAFTEVRRGQSEAAAAAAATAAAAAASNSSSSSASLVEAGDQMGTNRTFTEATTTMETTTIAAMTGQDEEYQRRRVAQTVRIACSTLSFVLSNIYVFLKCDKLSDRIIKIRSQLFKMNIDLACTFIMAQKRNNQELLRGMAIRQVGPIRPVIRIQSVTPETGVSNISGSSSHEDLSNAKQFKRMSKLSKSVYEINNWRQDATRAQLESYVNQCSELDQIWSLYDQVTRISSKVNFRFTSDTYYSKKCMLLVFGRSVSLVLFFIQIIDMYSS